MKSQSPPKKFKYLKLKKKMKKMKKVKKYYHGHTLITNLRMKRKKKASNKMKVEKKKQRKIFGFISKMWQKTRLSTKH